MNSSMYKRIWFRPRVMKDVAEVDTSSSVQGIPVKVPLFVCPTGLAKMINPEGEKALARAAKSSGILEIVSHAAPQALHPMLIRSAINECKSPARRHSSRSARLSFPVPTIRQQGPKEVRGDDPASRSTRR